MGSPAGVGWDDERPEHLVTIGDFLLAVYETTQKEYRSVTGAEPSYHAGDRRPVERVTWFDAVEYCNLLSDREGLARVYTITGRTPATGYPVVSAQVTFDMTKNGYRLPTEAEWEYAARGGAGSPGGYAYSGSNIIGIVGWYDDNSFYMTQETGLKMPNGPGVFDMTGNVWEWCQDYFGAYGSAAETDPTGPVAGTARIARGGSYLNTDLGCRSTFRFDNYEPGIPSPSIGFRVARRR